MDKFMSRLLVWGLIGFFAQFIDGSLGMGYGALSSTILIASGLYPAIVSACVHTAEIVTTFFSGGTHLWLGNVEKKWLLPLVIPGVVAGAAGAYLLVSIPGETMKPYVAGFLLFLGVLVLYRFLRRRVTATQSVKVSKSRIQSIKFPLLGFIAAFVDAVGGGGWGPIATPGLILTEDTEPRKVVGTVNIAEFFITIVISVTFILTLGWEKFDWELVLALIIGGVIAAPIAALLCKNLPVKILGILIGLLLVGLNLRTLLIVLL